MSSSEFVAPIPSHGQGRVAAIPDLIPMSFLSPAAEIRTTLPLFPSESIDEYREKEKAVDHTQR